MYAYLVMVLLSVVPQPSMNVVIAYDVLEYNTYGTPGATVAQVIGKDFNANGELVVRQWFMRGAYDDFVYNGQIFKYPIYSNLSGQYETTSFIASTEPKGGTYTVTLRARSLMHTRTEEDQAPSATTYSVETVYNRCDKIKAALLVSDAPLRKQRLAAQKVVPPESNDDNPENSP